MADKLALLDGNSIIYRAFHALAQNPLTSPSGELVHATYGFTLMLVRLLEDLRPTHLAAAFDTPKPTFRHQRFDAYKGTRAPMPDGLSHQFGRVYQLLEALHVPIFRVEGLEADDLLGTMADRASEQGLDVVVVTGDTDALQLVGPRVQVMVPRRGVTDTVVYDEAGVRERYGLEPSQLVDLRALRGDTTDNIPGVPGVGDKTASRLLATFGTVEKLLDSLDTLPPKQRDQLAPYAEQIRMSQGLAQIERNAPMEFDPETCRRTPLDREAVLALFHELGFRSLIDRLSILVDGAASPGASQNVAAKSGSRTLGLFDAPAEVDGRASDPGSPLPLGEGGGEGRPSVGGVAATAGRAVESLDELRTIVARLRDAGSSVSLVLALTRPEAMRAEIVGIALVGDGPDEIPVYVPFAPPADLVDASAAAGQPRFAEAEALDVLRPLLEDASVPKTSLHAKQAMVALARRGVELRGVTFDSGLIAYLIEASSRTLGLQDLSWSRLNRELPGIKTLTGEGRAAVALSAVPVDRMAAYFCREAETLAELRPILERELVENGLDGLYRDIELPLVDVLADVERAGIAVDVPYLQRFSAELHERITAVEAGIYGSVGHEFNINSPIQLANVLFDELKLPGAKKTATGKASTAADVLNFLRGAHPCVELILEDRELTKLKSTYVDALPLLVNPETGRIHTTFNQTVAATGRLSSENPNLQNIPVRTELGRRVRTAFIAPEPGWKLLSADYSQIELRIQAHLTQDPTLLEAFQEGLDVHVATAAELHGVTIEEVTSDMRRLAKTANFAIIYGISPFGFAEQTGMTQQQSADFIRRYFEKFHEVDAFQKRFVKEARETGVVMTLMGRKRTIPELRSPNHAVRAAGERMAVNAPVQGTASDIIKIAMVRLGKFMEDEHLRARLLLQVHDELLFEVPDEELDTLKAAAKEIMEGAMTLSVPLVVDFRAADSWGAMY